MTHISPNKYWIGSNAIHIELNAMSKPDYIQASVTSGAVIMAYDPNISGLGFDDGHNFRRWQLTASPTVFNSFSAKYVYAAIPRSGNGSAMIVFPSEEIDVYGKNESEEQIGSTDFYYVFLQGIISSSGDSGTTSRTWTAAINTGSLNTDEAINAPKEVEWYQYNSTTKVVSFLKNITLAAGVKFLNLLTDAISFVGGGSLIKVASFSSLSDNASNEAVTPAYILSREASVENKYLRKDKDDSTSFDLEMKNLKANGKADIFGNITVGGTATISGNTSIGGNASVSGSASVSGNTTFGSFITDSSGARIKASGDAEFESIKARGSLTVQDLRFQRANIILGTNIQSYAGGIIDTVVPSIDSDGNILPTGYATIQLEDDDLCGSVVAGDLCMGYWHDIDDKSNNASSDYDNHHGVINYKGFATVYFQVAEVVSGNSARFRYELKEGTSIHPYPGMHFRGIGSTTEEGRQGFTIATPNYTASYNNVSSFTWNPKTHCTAISGSNLDGFQAMVDVPATENWNNRPATILTNLYVKGLFTILQGKNFNLYITQPSNGMLLTGETEVVSFKVLNEAFEDVTSNWVFSVNGTVISGSSYSVSFESLQDTLTTFTVKAVKEGETDLEGSFSERRLLIDSSDFRIEPTAYSIKLKASDVKDETLTYDNGVSVNLDDGSFIEVASGLASYNISAKRICDTEVSTYGAFYYSINGAQLVSYSNDTEVTVHSGDDNITFYWFESALQSTAMPLNASSRMLSVLSVPITCDGEPGEDGDSNVKIDLDNENDSMLYNERGVLLSGAVTSQASVYYGTEDVSENASFSILETVNCTASITTAGKVTVSAMSDTKGKVIIKAVYQGKSYYATLSLTKLVNVDKFSIECVPNAISYNTTTKSLSANTVVARVFRTDARTGIREQVTNPSTYNLHFYVSGGEWNFDGDINITAIKAECEKGSASIQLKLTQGTDVLTAEQLDYETIPINYSANGQKGDSPALYQVFYDAEEIYYDSNTGKYSPNLITATFYKVVGETRTAYTDSELYDITEYYGNGTDNSTDWYFEDGNVVDIYVDQTYDNGLDRIEFELPSLFGTKKIFKVINANAKGPQGDPGTDAVSYSLIPSKTTTVENTVNDVVTFSLLRSVGSSTAEMASSLWELRSESAAAYPFTDNSNKQLSSTVGFTYGSTYSVGAYVNNKRVAVFTLGITAIGLRGTSFNFIDWSKISGSYTFYSDNPSDSLTHGVGKSIIGDVALYNNRKFLCIKSYYTTNVELTTPVGDTEHWTEVSWLGNIATNLLLAEKSIIDNLILNNMSAYPKNDDGTWNTESPNITIDGDTGILTAKNGNFEGTIRASNVNQPLNIYKDRNTDFISIGSTQGFQYWVHSIKTDGDSFISASDYIDASANSRTAYVQVWLVLPFACQTLEGKCIEITAPNFEYMAGRTSMRMMQIGVTAYAEDGNASNNKWIDYTSSQSDIASTFTLQFGGRNYPAVIMCSNKYITTNDESSISKLKVICTKVGRVSGVDKYNWLVQDSKNVYYSSSNGRGSANDVSPIIQ